ncbi:unnamed protein product (macronuclear) [Paramecium tetraurelia]|uniref:Uncharacterized protein n=1 Tax=Paramecium tetraurelia TaxID=5888 RepID=A0D7P8_PARTE|nr:uncharacterized protein GSPATT00014032001 [Paramecium tetraurelia]CAK79065.1 unnamed protein product [Paramecium tetraurelia]|eukprot:XP_001446462.1 hypothetical protein (macronuclear) [Paramecium tetraurelia strain d4-2]
MFQLYENAENSTYSFEFKLDLTLLNVLRSFTHKDHEFQEGYLESIYALLYYYQGKPESELFSEYCAQKGNHTIEALIFQVHYYIASLANLNQLVGFLKADENKVIPLSRSDINKTNILSVHSITDRVGSINSTVLVSKSQTVKPEYLDLRVKICTYENKEEGVFSIDYNVLSLAIQAKGKLDPLVGSHLANKLNKMFKLELYHILLHFADKKGQVTENYDERCMIIVNGVSNFSFHKKEFTDLRDKFIRLSYGNVEKNVDEITKLLMDLDQDVGKSIIARDTKSNHYLEKLLVGLLGNPLQLIRDQAIILLNILYDGVDWQKRVPFKPKITKVGSKFDIQYLFEYDSSYPLSSIVILLKSYIFDSGCKQNIVSWHKPKLSEYSNQGDKKYMAFKMDFGRFKRCGFYDWKLIRMTTSGKLQSLQKIMNLDELKSNVEITALQMMEAKPIQGRFIVHPRDSKNLQIHEIYVDLLDAKPDNQGKFTKRGNFRKVREKIPDLVQQGINCVYLMGTLERDNGLMIDQDKQQKLFKRPDVSPLAITCRLTPNQMLGGKEEFMQLNKVAQQNKLRIIVDMVTRISSARPHRKYRKDLVYRLDEQGRSVAMFGTDGRSIHFEDTIILNNRKKRVWDVLLEEMIELTTQYNIQGVHLDNGSSWPQIFSLDLDEMYRKDTDGNQAYSNKQIFSGEICLQNEDCGYWGSSVKNLYPNPFLVKICKSLWSKFPNFLIVAEAWGAMGEQEEREINLIQSGVIPRLFKLPIAIASIFGENLKKDGTMVKMERKNVNAIKKWIEYTAKQYPAGSIIVQSTTYNSWPYPALIYKRGTWAAVDLFFTLQDIPMTFMGEEEGFAFREKTTNVFNYVTKHESSEIKLQDPTQQKTPQRSLKRAESYVQVNEDYGFGYNTLTHQVQLQITQSPAKSSNSGQPVRVQSGSSLSQMDISNIATAQENFRREVGPQFGFDLQQIGKHYVHIRQMRKQHKVLRNGQMVSLSAEHMYGWHTHVLAFARYSKDEMALIAINFNDGEIDMFMNLRNLRYYFPNSERSNIVVRLRNWSYPNLENEETSYFYIGNFLTSRLEVHLKNFQSQIWGVEILGNSQEVQQKAQKSALIRLQQKMSSNIPLTIYGNDAANKLTLLTDNLNSLQQFINGFSHYYTRVIKPNNFDLNRLISSMKDFQSNKVRLCKLFAFFQSILGTQDKNLPFYDTLQQLINLNKLGPMCFCTPELGKWTTTGGLGVMVDELTQELAKMNEEVILITPYYHRNKKGETGYILSDGFQHIRNIEIWLQGEKIIMGVFEGVFNGVRLFWLHNEQYFPSAYAGEDASYVMKQLTVYAKGCLELLCQIKLIPSLIVTNDWFCGLIPGYLRVRRYGEAFAGTKSFHIVHNLDPLYEGRLYPKPNEGKLDYIHELPNDFFVDPYWQNLVINPSRCPLITCDNWGTVSQSYKYELLESSPLASVLRRHPHPFAFPNGIRREQRFKVIMDKTNNDHLKAKEQLQKKYFGCSQLENHIVVLGFVGRVTKQKGVHLILEVAEELIQRSQGTVQILVGGPADMKEEYSAFCAQNMIRLKSIYPRNFWADPSAFFMDGTLVNVGCDFGLMPSLFEPGGIVQHEFFIGSTPVIAFKTGGLRDTVHEYDQKQQKGSGFIFDQYNRGNFLYSIDRALQLYKNQDQYTQLRKNAFDAAIDVADVSRAWAQEYYRLFEKNFIDKELVQQMVGQIQQDYKELKEQELFTKEEGRVFSNSDKTLKNFERILAHAKRSNLRLHQFVYRSTRLLQPRQVAVSGSFDEWKEKHKLKFDHFSKVWNVTLKLLPGEYYYKFYVDGEWICTDDDLKDNDIYGNINNFVIIQ